MRIVAPPVVVTWVFEGFRPCFETGFACLLFCLSVTSSASVGFSVVGVGVAGKLRVALGDAVADGLDPRGEIGVERILGGAPAALRAGAGPVLPPRGEIGPEADGDVVLPRGEIGPELGVFVVGVVGFTSTVDAAFKGSRIGVFVVFLGSVGAVGLGEAGPFAVSALIDSAEADFVSGAPPCGGFFENEGIGRRGAKVTFPLGVRLGERIGLRARVARGDVLPGAEAETGGAPLIVPPRGAPAERGAALGSVIVLGGPAPSRPASGSLLVVSEKRIITDKRSGSITFSTCSVDDCL